jgi:hypothetical protein
MKLYAFDVDDTLEISNGPVRLADMQALRNSGEHYRSNHRHADFQ